MKSFIALSLLVVIASAATLPDMSSKDMEGRITRGELAVAGQFPYQVGLGIAVGKDSFWCGGTIISNRWILTAAHCTDEADGITVYLGAIDIRNNNEKGQQRIFISKSYIIVHENWDAEKLLNDISLIKLPVAIEFNERIQPAMLPKKTGVYSSYEGDTVWASGWGRDSDSALSVSQYLRYIEMPIVKQSVCKTYYLGQITDEMICLSGKSGKSICDGDSGGPIVYKDNGVNYVIGATSFGIKYCEKGWPTVFTRVTSYLDWIEEKTGIVNN